MHIYRNIAVVIELASRLPALLTEAARFERNFGASLTLLVAGGRREGIVELARVECERLGIRQVPSVVSVTWPLVDSILRAVDDCDCDLVIAGASGRESVVRYFVGSVARRLAREAEVSILLLINPGSKPRPIRRIVVTTDFSETSMIALRKAIHLAAREESESLHVLRIHPGYAEAMALAEGADKDEVTDYQRRTISDEVTLLADFVDAAGISPVPIKASCLEGNPGQVVIDYVNETEADLLVLSTDHRARFIERVFPSDIERILRNIPCDLWLVRETVE